MCIYHLTCINKVRAYIDEVKMLSSSSSSKSKKEDNFPLSPGRRSQSMSNLAAEGERKQLRPDSGSTSNLSRMKAFISTSHLEDLRITLRRNEVRMRVMCSNF